MMRNFLKLSLVVMSFIAFVGCSKDDPAPTATIRVNNAVVANDDDFVGDINGDFTGDGGSVTRTFNWQNALTTADYNADITATATGMFTMVVRDADGTVVLDRSLDGAVEPDSFSGVTSAGTSGNWSVTISVTNFNGDGSYSLSEGN
ncbi:MAG: hypothetical protein CMC14_03255 [Flavobacteriaceae bacterium]|nr:hypothetical protein [Flavobacteriaceae bacterium]|tara:strand:+ start:97 stop:537 length:441 start_codon:yes stop_codon:yes gene_type:complete